MQIPSICWRKWAAPCCFLLAGFEIDPKSITGEDGRHGLYTWIVTFILAIGAAMAVPIFAAGQEDILAWRSLLTTTATGTLMPILWKRRNVWAHTYRRPYPFLRHLG